MSRLQKFSKRLIGNLGLKLISLGCAIGVWAWVQSETIVEEDLRITVRYIWPTELEKIKEPRSTINVTLKGPQGRLKAIDDIDMEALIDLSEIKIGRSGIDLTESDILNIPNGVSIQRISPPTIEVELDLPMEKTVSIKPNIVGSVPEGWKILNATASPDKIVLKGARTLLVGLSEISSDAIDVKQLTSTKTFNGKLSLPHSTLRTDPKPISITVEVGTLFEKKRYERVPIVIRHNDSWEITPNEVMVEMEGPLSELEDLDRKDMTILVHLPNDERDAYTLNYEPGTENNRFKVVHDGSDSIKPLQLIPPRLSIIKERKPILEPEPL